MAQHAASHEGAVCCLSHLMRRQYAANLSGGGALHAHMRTVCYDDWPLVHPACVCVLWTRAKWCLTVVVWAGGYRVFTAASTQEDVFRREGTLAAERVMSGYPASLLLYGTAGSGKTHTLFGPRENPGVGPQCVASLLKMAGEAERADAEQPLVNVSCYEMHQNTIYDLLVGKHHEVQFGGKDVLGKTSDAFAKIGISTVEQFWDLVTRLREVRSHLDTLEPRQPTLHPIFAAHAQCLLYFSSAALTLAMAH